MSKHTAAGEVAVETDLAADALASASPNGAALRLLFVSDVCFVGEAVAGILERDPAIASVRCADPAETVALNLTAQADAALVDTALREGTAVVRGLRDLSPSIPIIACAVRETDDDVIAWARAGATGYLPNTIRLDQFARTVRSILSGEQICSGRVAAGLLRRIAAAGSLGNGDDAPLSSRWLTRRERQIAELIAAGRRDKEIAHQLNISLATSKSHVHNLLGKLNVQRRGDVVGALRGHLPPWPR